MRRLPNEHGPGYEPGWGLVLALLACCVLVWGVAFWNVPAAFGGDPETTTTLDETTTTEAPPATTAPVVTTTTSEPGPSIVECFYAGQDGADLPPEVSIECSNAWSSGRQTSLAIEDEANRDDAYRAPFLALAGLLVFFAAARTVRGWRR